MVTSLTPVEQGILYANMKDLVLHKSKLINDNYDGTSDKFFTPIMIEIALSESLGYICDYILRPDRYVMNNPTIHYIWADIVIDILTSRYNTENTDESSAGGTIADASNIAEFKQGDTTIKMKSEISSPTGHKLDLDDTIKAYKQRLNRYRRPI